MAHKEWDPSALLSIDKLGEVEQVFLNFLEDPTQMRVAWVTDAESASDVQFGTSPTSLTQSATGNSSVYHYGFFTSAWQHFATMEGLSTASTYYYRVGDASTGSWSEVSSFQSHPGVGPDIPYVFGVIGDLGQTKYSNDTVHHVLANAGVQSAILAGDLSYADGDQPRWDSWRRMVQPLTSTMSMLAAPGNHEIESFFGLNFVPYRARFRFPCAEQCTSPTFPLYYAVNVGPVRLIVMNSFGNYSEGSDQLAWARKQFQSVDLSLTPWVVLMEHTPMYSSNIDHYDSGKPLLALIEDDIKPLGKRMVVLAGHVHAYERSHPVYNNTVDETGPVYVTIGDGGNREGLYDAWTQPQPAWSAVRKAEYGHGVLRANSTALAWEWHTITTDEPVVSDSFVRTL